MRRTFLAILFVFAAFVVVSAEDTPTSMTDPKQSTSSEPADVAEVRQQFADRETLIGELRDLALDLDALLEKKGDLPSLEKLEQDLKLAKDATTIAAINVRIQARRADEKQILEDVLTKKKVQDEKRRKLFSIEQRIASLFDARRDENYFRGKATIIFSILVVIVVAGFYFIVVSTGVAKTIFSGEQGMQFVTLFLIVIAIILFGIMGILEGKELAALLGGLSGYILGRTGASSGGKDSSNQNPPPQGNQANDQDAAL